MALVNLSLEELLALYTELEAKDLDEDDPLRTTQEKVWDALVRAGRQR